MTATDDTVWRFEDNPNIVLTAMNIACYTNDAYFGNQVSVPAIIRANAVVWFEAPCRPFDFMFQNLNAGSNTTIVIYGPVKR
jgi:hypothetical protein